MESSGRRLSSTPWVAKWTLRYWASSGPVACEREASNPRARKRWSGGTSAAIALRLSSQRGGEAPEGGALSRRPAAAGLAAAWRGGELRGPASSAGPARSIARRWPGRPGRRRSPGPSAPGAGRGPRAAAPPAPRPRGGSPRRGAVASGAPDAGTGSAAKGMYWRAPSATMSRGRSPRSRSAGARSRRESSRPTRSASASAASIRRFPSGRLSPGRRLVAGGHQLVVAAGQRLDPLPARQLEAPDRVRGHHPEEAPLFAERVFEQQCLAVEDLAPGSRRRSAAAAG